MTVIVNGILMGRAAVIDAEWVSGSCDCCRQWMTDGCAAVIDAVRGCD
jgi:hypothetical protein